MVAVLPYVPGFGEKLADALGQAGSNLAQGYVKKLENQRTQNIFNLLQDPNKSPIQKVTAFSQLPEQIKKSTSPIWAAVLGPQAQAEADFEQFKRYFPEFVNQQSNQPTPQQTSNPQAQTQPLDPSQNQSVQPQIGQQSPAQSVTPNAQPAQQNAQAAPNPNDSTTWPDELLPQLAAAPGILGRRAANEQERRRYENKLKIDQDRFDRKESTDKEKRTFDKNEPELKKLVDELKDLEIEDARLERLQNLYSDTTKFPPAWMAAILSKEGQINPVAASLLSPEAQEAIKLTIDSLSGAQSTFGGKVSNFEAATYLKRNATLMNTPEGRQRILEDLRSINKMSRNYSEGILDIIEEKGGSDKFSYTSAERLWRKRNEENIKDLRDRLVNPPNGTFKEMPNAAKNKGRKVQNESTGEIFISDGTSWKPFEGQ